ncbi:unnamed protein product (macronuclear) [Paramecium tetraurelia]|uniref:Transmembrane protein n=1 Tax=Paramecium tetraurelia TaxID=5888 RepID=A0DMU1_PARTE|nr:uncharacterized protein GSPATT00018562001 [Paramecium tetraurelia]CAK84358.1 unnamed protein product [Paramecium tetraurelia]|eukprot:XP_001451755.1 hypothetical protein (macronuclear) [Paramecium tetraurelia strain d4-2]
MITSRYVQHLTISSGFKYQEIMEQFTIYNILIPIFTSNLDRLGQQQIIIDYFIQSKIRVLTNYNQVLIIIQYFLYNKQFIHHHSCLITYNHRVDSIFKSQHMIIMNTTINLFGFMDQFRQYKLTCFKNGFIIRIQYQIYLIKKIFLMVVF